MQNRYLLDSGDFGKFLLIKTFANSKFRIGLNWYLVDKKIEEKESLKNNDGKHKNYLKDAITSYAKKYQSQFKETDTVLFDALSALFKTFKQYDLNIKLIESEKILPENVIFFDKPIEEKRENWFENSIKKFEKCELILCDPDNGILMSSNQKSKISHKYILENEIIEYLNLNKSIIIYQHLHRIKTDKFIEKIKNELSQIIDTNISISFVYSGKGTGRLYIFLVQLHHLEYVNKQLEQIKNNYKKILTVIN